MKHLHNGILYSYEKTARLPSKERCEKMSEPSEKGKMRGVGVGESGQNVQTPSYVITNRI